MSEASSEAIVGRVTLTNQDIENAFRELPNRGRGRLRAALLIVIVIGAADIASGAEWWLALFLFLSTAVVLVPALWFFDRKILPKLFVPALAGRERDLVFYFEADGVRIEGSTSRIRLGYDAVTRIVQGRTTFLVYSRLSAVQIVPKRAFLATDLARVDRLLRERGLLR